MVGRKKRKDEASSSSDSDDEVLSKFKKTNVSKKNGGRSNNKRSSVKTKARANKTSDEESDSEQANDSEPQDEIEKSKDTNGKRQSGRPNKSSAKPANRPKRNAEATKETSKKRPETDEDESSEESSQENDRSNASEKNGRSESQTKRSPEKRETKPTKVSAKKEKKEEEEEYEVEEIIDYKIEDKTKYFLVRWKGYDSGSDSWVSRRDLHCTGLIAQFYEKRPEASLSTRKRRKKRDLYLIGKKQKKPVQPAQRQLKIDEQPDYDSEAFDENQEWKVEKIIDVRYHRDKKRDFLIRWEGFSWRCDSWEPEENLDCKELIKKFTAKLEVIVNATVKDLRPVRKQTQRYTVMDVAKGRRLSKRFDGRQRASYYDCDE